jgi:hypothetical protein
LSLNSVSLSPSNPFRYSNNPRHWEAFNRVLDAIDEAAKER